MKRGLSDKPKHRKEQKAAIRAARLKVKKMMRERRKEDGNA